MTAIKKHYENPAAGELWSIANLIFSYHLQGNVASSRQAKVEVGD